MSFLFSSSSEGEAAPPPRLSPVKSSIEEANKHIQALCQRVAQLEAEKDAIAQHFQQKQTEFESLRQTLDRCQERLSHRDVQTKNLELTAASREEIILELESHLVAHQRELHAKSEALTSLEMLLSDKETVYERVADKVAEYQRLLDVKNRLLEAAAAQNREAEDDLERGRSREEALNAEIRRLEGENQRLKKVENEKNRSTNALNKILSYSASIEGLVVMLKEAATLDKKDEDSTSGVDEVVDAGINGDPVAHVANGNGIDTEKIVTVNGWNHNDESTDEDTDARETNDVNDQIYNDEDEREFHEQRVLTGCTNGEMNGHILAVEEERDSSSIVYEGEGLPNGRSDISSPTPASTDEGTSSDFHVDHAALESTGGSPSAFVDDGEVAFQDSTDAEIPSRPTEISAVTLPLPPPGRKSGEDRIASILLFNSVDSPVDDEERDLDESASYGGGIDEETCRSRGSNMNVASVGVSADEDFPGGEMSQNGYYANDGIKEDRPPSNGGTNSHSTEFFV